MTINLVLGLLFLSLQGTALAAQDLSKYRDFSLGASLQSVLKRTDKKSADVARMPNSPDTFQEVTWWPPSLPGTSYRSDSVEQVLFNFFRGELYKISVTYDQSATQELTTKDMVSAISAKYGPPTSTESEAIPSPAAGYETHEKTVATWENSEYSLNLIHYSFTSHFGLVIYAKRANVDAEATLVEAAKAASLNAPARETERLKKQADDLEMTRQKNQQKFRP